MKNEQHIHKIFADITQTIQEAINADLKDVVASLQQTKKTMTEVFLELHPEHKDIIESYQDDN